MAEYVYLVNLFPLMREKVFSTREKAELYLYKISNKSLDFINYEVVKTSQDFSGSPCFEITSPGLSKPIIAKVIKLKVDND